MVFASTHDGCNFKSGTHHARFNPLLHATSAASATACPATVQLCVRVCGRFSKNALGWTYCRLFSLGYIPPTSPVLRSLLRLAFSSGMIHAQRGPCLSVARPILFKPSIKVSVVPELTAPSPALSIAPSGIQGA